MVYKRGPVYVSIIIILVMYALCMKVQAFPFHVANLQLTTCTGTLCFFYSFIQSQTDDLDAVGVTNYVDYSNDILQLMRTSSLNATTPQDCCNYRYQILDDFCATRDSVRTVV